MQTWMLVTRSHSFPDHSSELQERKSKGSVPRAARGCLEDAPALRIFRRAQLFSVASSGARWPDSSPFSRAHQPQGCDMSFSLSVSIFLHEIKSPTSRKQPLVYSEPLVIVSDCQD